MTPHGFRQSLGPVLLRLIVAALLAVSAMPRIALAQDSSGTRPFQFGGQLSMYLEAYRFSATAPDLIARRPNGTARVIGSPTLTLFGLIRVPCTLLFSTEDNATRQSFNQVGLDPTFGWLTGHFGSHYVQFSELSLGDVTIYGLGLDARPGPFRFSMTAGRVQRGIPAQTIHVPDTIPGRTRTILTSNATFARYVYAAKLGLGREGETVLDINLIRVRDDPASLGGTDSISRATVTPQENLVLSLNWNSAFLEGRVQFFGEAAGAAYTRDMDAPENSSSIPPFMQGLFQGRLSSRTDFAAQIGLAYSGANTSVRSSIKYIGPGYTTLGYAQLQSDRLEWTIAPSFRLFDNRVYANVSLGQRTDNLLNTQIAPAVRGIYNGSFTAQVTRDVGLDGTFANYSIENRVANDTTKIKSVSLSYGLTPRAAFLWGRVQNSVFLSYMHQRFDDQNRLTDSLNDASTSTEMASWTVLLPSGVALTPTLTLTSTTAASTTSDITNLSLTGGYRMLGGKLFVSGTLGYTSNHVTLPPLGTPSHDSQIIVRLNSTFSLNPNNFFTLNLTHNRYRYGAYRANAAFDETLGSIQYTVTF